MPPPLPLAVTAATWSAWAAWATFVVLAGTLVWIAIQATETRRLREAQTRPFVVLDFEVHQRSRYAYFIVENHGTTLAKDVRIEAQSPLESVLGEKYSEYDLSRSHLLQDGIPALAPGKRISGLFDSVSDRKDRGLPMQFRMEVRYEDAYGRRSYRELYSLDLQHRVGLAFVVDKGTHEVADELKTIREMLRRWEVDMQGIQVYVRDREAYDHTQRLPGEEDGPAATVGWRRVWHLISGRLSRLVRRQAA